MPMFRKKSPESPKPKSVEQPTLKPPEIQPPAEPPVAVMESAMAPEQPEVVSETSDGLHPDKWYALMNERADLLARLAAKSEIGAYLWGANEEQPSQGFSATSRLKKRLLKIDNELKNIEQELGANPAGRDLTAEFNAVVDNDEKYSLMLDVLSVLKQKQGEAQAQEYAIISEGKGNRQGLDKADRQALQEIRFEIQTLQQQEQLLESAPETALFYRMATLELYRETLQTKNFVETPSRQALSDRISFHIQNHEPILLEGETGTGKTELALNLCRKLYNREPELISGSPDVRASDLLVKTGLRASETAGKKKREELAQEIADHLEQYKQTHPQATDMDLARENDNYARLTAASAGITPETYYVYGPLVRAMTEGLPLIIDEANLIEPRLRMVLKRIYNAKPGDHIAIAGDGQATVAHGFCIIMTANLKGEKHTERYDFDEAEKRVMINSTIHVDYLPENELYDLILAKSMDSQGEAPLSRYEAEMTLKNFCDAVAMIQSAYKDKPTETYAPKDARGKQQEFKEGVLDPGAALRMLNGLEAKDPQESLTAFLNRSILNYASNRNYNGKDRELIAKIMMSKGFLQDIEAKQLEIPDLDDSTLAPFMAQAEAEPTPKPNQAKELNRRELAELDPYELRKLANIKIGEGFQAQAPRPENPTGAENQESGEYRSTLKTKHYLQAEGRIQETSIEFDFEKTLSQAKKFYQDHQINLSPDFETKAKSIWTRNYEAIKKEAAAYGYDHLLVIPDALPPLSNLHAKMTQGYAATYESSNFTTGGSFAGAKNSRSRTGGFRLILTHQDNAKNLEDQPLLKATLNKSPEKLTGKTQAEIEAIIDLQGDLPINIALPDIAFGADQNRLQNTLQAEGLTLAEYLIFQRQYFESNQKHLDEKGWTWLLSTFSARRLAGSGWLPDTSRLYVSADDAVDANGDLGCRPSRSFK